MPNPAQDRPHTHDYRPELLESEDPVFFGTAALFSLLAVTALGVLSVGSAPANAAMSPADVSPRIAQLVLALPPPAPTPPAEPLTTAPSPVAPTPAPSSDAPHEADLADAPAPQDQPQTFLDHFARAAQDPSSPLAQLTQATDRPSLALEQALDQITHAPTASVDPTPGPRYDSPTGPNAEVRDVVLREVSMDTAPHLDDGPAHLPTFVELLGDEIDHEMEDPDAIRRTVAANRGRIEACYERALKVNPGVQGRIEVLFFVADGRTASPDALLDTTGDAALTQCVLTAFRRMRFPPSAHGEAVFPFVFSAQP